MMAKINQGGNDSGGGSSWNLTSKFKNALLLGAVAYFGVLPIIDDGVTGLFDSGHDIGVMTVANPDVGAVAHSSVTSRKAFAACVGQKGWVGCTAETAGDGYNAVKGFLSNNL